MTEEELGRVPFKWMSHLSLEHKHCTTYANEEYGFGICKHTLKKDEFTFDRTYTHYMYNGVVYKTKAKFLEAIKDVEI